MSKISGYVARRAVQPSARQAAVAGIVASAVGCGLVAFYQGLAEAFGRQTASFQSGMGQGNRRPLGLGSGGRSGAGADGCANPSGATKPSPDVSGPGRCPDSGGDRLARVGCDLRGAVWPGVLPEPLVCGPEERRQDPTGCGPRQLNTFVVYHHFKMEGIPALRDILEPGNYLAKVNLKDAYLSVPIAQMHQHFLAFKWEGKVFQFRALPFGLASAPFTFMKILHPVMVVLRQLGIRLIVYLDNILVLGRTAEETSQAVTTLLHLLYTLGFVVNLAKSVLTPSQVLEFLGFEVCTVSTSLRLSERRIQKILKACQEALGKTQISLRELASCIGMMTAAWPGVLPTPLHLRGLQRLLNMSPHRNLPWGALVHLDLEARSDLVWWTNHLTQWNGRPVRAPAPVLVIRSDAATHGGGGGWGAVCGAQATGGRWAPEEQRWHINALELLAGFFAFQCFARNTSNCLVVLEMDNMVAVQYVNKMGDTRSQRLCGLAEDLWHWCLDRNTVNAHYLPGDLNTEADWGPSRRVRVPAVCTLRPRSQPGPASRRGIARAGGTVVEGSNVVPAAVGGSGGSSGPSSGVARPAAQREQRPALADGERTAAVSRVAHLRSAYTTAELPGSVSSLLLASWRRGTGAHYDSAWRLWSRWCEPRSVNPTCPPLKEVLSFLADQFRDQRSYRMVAEYRSALSSTLPPVDGVAVGAHPLVTRLIKGVYNLRPPKPR